MNRFNRNLTQLALAIAAISSASMSSAAPIGTFNDDVSAKSVTIRAESGVGLNVEKISRDPIPETIQFGNEVGGPAAPNATYNTPPAGSTNPVVDPITGKTTGFQIVTGTYTISTPVRQTEDTKTQIINDQKFELSSTKQDTTFNNKVDKETTYTYTFNPDTNTYERQGSVDETIRPLYEEDLLATTTAQDQVILGKENATGTTALTVRNTATGANGLLVTSETVVSAAGVTATGNLTIGGNTTVQALNAGATGVSTLNASGLVTAGNGLNVTGDTSVQKLTAGDTSVQKLTAGDTSVQKLTAGDTSVQKLTAGDTSVQKLTAGATGVTTLTASDLVTAGKGLNVTGDTNVQKLTAGDTSVQKLTAGKVTTSNIDLGSSTNSVIVPTAASSNRLTARYDTTDTTGKAVTIYETQSSGVSTYYTISAGVATEFKNATVIGTLGKTVAPTAGGTTTAQSTLNTTTAAVKEVTSQATTYGETKTQQDAVTVNGTLNNGEAVSVNVGTGASVELNNQSVVTGIIGTNGGNNVYGTVATAKDTNAQGVLTSNKTAALTAGGVTVKDTVAGTSSSLTASGLTTAAITLAGKDLGGEISRIDLAATAETKARTDADVALKTSVDKEVADRTAADALIRTDFTTADTAIRNAATAETTRVNSEVNRLDGRVTSLASTVDSNFRYLDGRVNQVERTANRGVAISLAAQQSVPNLSAGRTAIYGGVGHYEGESALAFGVATMLKDNRTAFSLAIGASGSKEIGGRAGVSFVFGE